MGVDRRRFFGGQWAFEQNVEDSELHDDFQRFMHGEEGTRPVNEEIERVYRHLKPYEAKSCPHGKTFLTCGECYINESRGYL